MGERLLAICTDLAPQRILELGCGTGRLTARLRQHWPQAEIQAIDVAESMLPIARERVPDAHFILADAESYAPVGQFDLVISNATAQWFADPAGSLARFPCQQLAFSTFTANTFCELRNCFAAAGEQDRILPMPTAGHWRALAAQLGTIENYELRNEQRQFASVHKFVDTIRRSGAANAYAAKPLRPSRWREVVQDYESRFRSEAGVTATYEQVFLRIRVG